MKNALIILIILVLETSLFANHLDEKWLDDITIEEIDLMKFEESDVDYFLKITFLAKKAKNTVENKEFSNKGDLLLFKLSDVIGEKIKSGELNPLDKKVTRLLEVYEAEKFHIYQPKIHDFIKLMHYSCVGMYGHILNRFYDSVFFYPVISLLVLFFTSVLTVNFYFKNRKFRLLYNRILIVLVILGLIMTLSFKATCDECIQDDSFYGITF